MAATARAQLLQHFTHALEAFQRAPDVPFRVVTSLGSTARPTAGQNGTLVVLDSSFNPPTRAHLRMATSAIQAAGRASAGTTPVQLLLLLAVNNADKGVKPAAFPHRLAMMELFARDLMADLLSRSAETAGEASELDLAIHLGLTTLPYFHDKSRAIATSGAFTTETPTGGGATAPEQVFLAGFDTLIRIFNPKYYGPVTSDGGPTPMQQALGPFFDRARLRITLRTDAEWGSRDDQFAYLENLRSGGLEDVGGLTAWADRVELVEGRQGGEEVVSSTAVREAVKLGDWNGLDGLVSEGVKGWIQEQGLYAEA